jgi:hypothetical protein
VDEGIISPEFEYSCGDALVLAKLLFNGTDQCNYIQLVEDFCCQNKRNQSLSLDIDSALDVASYEAGNG